MDLIHSCCESLSQKGLVSIWMEKKAGLLEGGALSAERALEKLARMRALDGGYLFGGALRYDASAAVASLRPEVYYVKGPAGRPLGELPGELDPLRLAA